MKTLLALAQTWSLRRKVWTAVAAAAALLLIVVSASLALRQVSSVRVASVSKPSTCADAYRLLALRPSQIAAAKPVCLVQSLQFSGELAGTVGEAYPAGPVDPGPTAMCAEPKRWSSYPQALLAIVIGGRAYRLRIAFPGSSDHQTATISNLTDRVELQAVKDPASDWNQASGALTINADGVSGNIDASLERDVAGARPVKVSGQWACGTEPALPAVDAGTPCSSFYVLNHLADADVARMKATACNAEDLTFSGDVVGHVDHAITDTSIGSSLAGLVPGGDNNCSTNGESFVASLKLSIGDESFLLDMTTDNYPAVGPGQYPATPYGSAPGVVLQLGTADPNNNGRFVADDQVFWLATSGSFTISPDMKTGTVDAIVQGYADHHDSTVHITGRWRCAA